MKIKDIRELAEVYAYRRGRHGTADKAVVIQTALWQSETRSASRQITPAPEGSRAGAPGYGRTIGSLILLAKSGTDDQALRDLAAKLDVDAIAKDVDAVEKRYLSEFEVIGARIMAAPATRLVDTWEHFTDQEAADRARRLEQIHQEQEKRDILDGHRSRARELADLLGVRLGHGYSTASLEFSDLVTLLERLARAEGKLP